MGAAPILSITDVAHDAPIFRRYLNTADRVPG